ncbi:MAG TPA: TlpA disulfide reductase family protein [Pararobbsia sp.]|nr:TlpA disulfide reductase family protein [Pararobbsia sp.]
MARRFLASALVVCAALAVGGYAAGPQIVEWASGAEHGPNAAVSALWATTLPAPDNTQQALSQFKGKALVVNFWASWCGPCIAEMPALSALHKQYAAKGINFVGIAVDTAPNVQGFVHRVNVNYPLVIAGFGGGDLARQFGDEQGALPFTVVIDASGKVRSTTLGQVKPEKLAQTLDAL